MSDDDPGDSYVRPRPARATLRPESRTSRRVDEALERLDARLERIDRHVRRFELKAVEDNTATRGTMNSITEENVRLRRRLEAIEAAQDVASEQERKQLRRALLAAVVGGGGVSAVANILQAYGG